MSETGIVKGITATFQHVLNMQIAKAMNAIDEGDTFDAYTTLQTLIDSLNPKDTVELRKDIKAIDDRINKALRLEGVDLVQTRRIQKSTAANVTKQHTRRLFRKVMAILHEGGYLERYFGPRHTGKKKLSVDGE